MDFTEMKTWLEQKVNESEAGSVTFAGMEIFKDVASGKLIIQDSQQQFSMMDFLPAEIFDKLSAGISVSRMLDADAPPDRTPEEKAAYDLLST
ncbi:MAG: hypothetical protein MUP71_11625 [Candidatus Aminicenantes bacterium]|nr:hypothetical protein [Candidatus Aminicenantes bacterium]